MTPEAAKAITNAVAKKHKTFRHIETTYNSKGASIAFAPLDEPDPRAIAGWFDAAGGVVLMIGREWVNTGFVMYVELRA